MRRCLIYFLLTSPLLAQTFRPAPQQAPIDALIQSYQSALSNGQYGEAAAKRDQARALLSMIPVNDPQFVNWAQRVSQIYDSGGFALQARDVLEQSLTRTGALGASSPARATLLSAIASSWEQDRNLLKAVSYLEQAVAATETQSATAAQAQTSASRLSAAGGVTVAQIFAPSIGSRFAYFGANDADLYQRLFGLYRRLGRPQDAAAVLARVATHVRNNDQLLASLYQQQGQIDNAAAIYKRQAAEAADPQQAAAALQSLASLYQSVQRYSEAADAMQQAIAKSGISGDANSSLWMRQYLANLLQQAGQTQAADGVYQQLMAQTSQRLDTVTGYAAFLEQTQRVDQAEKLLNDYEANHSSGQLGEQTSLMQALANVERLSGKADLAEEYQRRASAGQQPFFGSVPSADAMQSAITAANAGKLDEAYNFAMQALDSAHSPSDLVQAQYVAQRLGPQRAASADEIYRRTTTLAGSWSAATVTPIVDLDRSRAAFLQDQQRWSEFDQTLNHWAGVLTTARGAATGWLEDVLRERAEPFRPPDRIRYALAAAQELVKLEESLSGDTSDAYLNAIQTLADALEHNGDRVGALPSHQKAVAITDLVYNPNDSRRITERTSAAMAYARAGQFDEAEALAREADTLSQQMHLVQPGYAMTALHQIMQMKQAAQQAQRNNSSIRPAILQPSVRAN